jgi:hypothetical protein
MVRNKIFLLILSFFAALAVSCFSSWSDTSDLGTFAISTGGNARSSVDPEIISRLEHTVTLSGNSGQKQEKTFTGSKTVRFTVNPGLWDINVEAKLDGTLFAIGSEEEVEIKSGPNGNIDIYMRIIGDGGNTPTSFVIFIEDIANQVPVIETGIVIYLSGTPGGNPSSTATIIVQGDFEEVDWYINGFEHLYRGKELKLDCLNSVYGVPAENVYLLTEGVYFLTLEVKTMDGKFYSSTVSFEVAP